jgi:hypothetical protein
LVEHRGGRVVKSWTVPEERVSLSPDGSFLLQSDSDRRPAEVLRVPYDLVLHSRKRWRDESLNSAAQRIEGEKQAKLKEAAAPKDAAAAEVLSRGKFETTAAFEERASWIRDSRPCWKRSIRTIRR